MRYMVFSALLISIFVLCSCSGTNPVLTGDKPVVISDNTGQTSIAGSGQLILDPSGEICTVIPDRTLEFHYNVTSLLSSGCPGGCFTFRVLGISGDVWTIELKIVNPTSIQVYDVRLMYCNTYGKTVLNPDGYIDLFGYQFKPFTAFAKELPQRAFPLGPSGFDTENLELKWPSGQPANVTYLIEVSIGGNCDEPYKLEGLVLDEIPTSGISTQVSATAWDWQDNVTECWCDWTSIGGSQEQMLLSAEGNGFRKFALDIDAPAGLAPGEYPLILMVREYIPKELRLYNIIKATVIESSGPVNLSNDSVPTGLNFTSKTVSAWNDHVYVVWSEDITGDNKAEIILKEYDGGWKDDLRVSQETFNLNRWDSPSIAVNMANGDVHTMWEGYADSNGAVGYSKRTGETWTEPTILFRGAFCMDSQIDVENNGEVHIVLQDSDGPFLCIFWIHDPGTGTFADPFVLAEDFTPMTPYYAPAIDHDDTGVVHVPITTGANGNNNIAYKKWNNTIWSTLQWVCTDNNSIWQDITVAPDRKATMVYRKDDQDIYMKQYTTTWTTESRCTTGATIYGIPNIDADSDGNIHMAFCGEGTGNKDIYYTVMDGITKVWSTPENLTANASESKDPSLFVGSDDRVHVVWTDNSDGDADVYYLVK